MLAERPTQLDLKLPSAPTHGLVEVVNNNNPQQPQAKGLLPENCNLQAMGNPAAVSTIYSPYVQGSIFSVPAKSWCSQTSKKTGGNNGKNEVTLLHSFVKGYVSASGSNQGAIDNRIEQAMDLVKSHLMNAVRSEVEELKEKIIRLEDTINVLQAENEILRTYAPIELVRELHAQQQQLLYHHQAQAAAQAQANAQVAANVAAALLPALQIQGAAAAPAQVAAPQPALQLQQVPALLNGPVAVPPPQQLQQQPAANNNIAPAPQPQQQQQQPPQQPAVSGAASAASINPAPPSSGGNPLPLGATAETVAAAAQLAALAQQQQQVQPPPQQQQPNQQGQQQPQQQGQNQGQQPPQQNQNQQQQPPPHQ